MTLDEAITLLKFNNKHIADLKNDDLQQIAEWLEELKVYKSDDYTSNLQTLVYRQGYNKAIDDFSERIKQVTYTSGTEFDGYYKIHAICERDIDEIAEQLKAGDGE